ncbi:MAG TPA: YdjY domain-containing protein [Planctomycetota bacterium]|nr:YdjY domain-containing protein [Planctomycetota bacterium]
MIAALVGFFAQAAPAPQGPSSTITVDKEKKAVYVKSRIAPRKLPSLPDIYPIEVIATFPTPKGQKAHETVVIYDAVPSEVHKAIESLGLKPGKPGRGEETCSGPELEIYLDLPPVGKFPAREVRIENTLLEKRTGKPLPPIKWHFTGSVLREKAYASDLTGTLISLYPVTDEVVAQSGLSMKEEGMLKLETAKSILPPENTPVTLIIRVASGAPAPPASLPFDPERQVLKLSRTVGPAEMAPPVVSVAGAPPSSAGSDPFEYRREVHEGKSLVDAIRPVDLPPAK